MGKKKCSEKDYKVPDSPKYACKKCGRTAKNEDKICKPLKLNN